MKKRTSKWIARLVLFSIVASLALTGCESKVFPDPEITPPASIGAPTSPSPVATETSATKDRVFTDSVDREITLPANLTRLAPSGTLAQIILFTACPELMCGIAIPYTDSQLKLIDSKYKDLPVFGKFYGKGPDFNLETVLVADTQVIVDFGEAKDSTVDDMNGLMNQIHVPTVFIQATFRDMPETFRQIGLLIGDTSRTDQLAKYCEESLALSEKAKAAIPEDERVKVYWALGDFGLNTNAVGSFHSEILDYVPVINVADVESSNRGGGSEVSMEQVILWDPDYILVDNVKLLQEMEKDPAWTALPAMKAGKVLIVPTQPYGFLSDPPSVNRYLGVGWLGATFYPDLYTRSVKDEVLEFLKLFYDVEPSDTEFESIMAGTFK
ncbi:MAG TPA: ABC transporter substrate-binding protein [Clostridia bacterium]|nr:ABC transporter substrate-binding protein [Clostridia bacterium]